MIPFSGHDCRMLSRDQFWSLIDTPHGRIHAENSAELSAQLAKRGTATSQRSATFLLSWFYAIDSRYCAEFLIVDPSEGDKPMNTGERHRYPPADVLLRTLCRAPWQSSSNHRKTFRRSQSRPVAAVNRFIHPG